MALTKLSTDVIDLSGNTTALTIPSGTTSNINLDAVDWLVVAGGASGGSNGGGGGAGGLRTSYGSTAPGTTGTIESALSLTHSVAYTATVGAGGAALIMAAGYQLQGNAGGTSSLSGTGITTITTDGGGGGASNQVAAANGGSGGGGGSGVGVIRAFGTGTANQGFDGGAGASSGHPYRGGGGGGADAAGSDYSSGNGGAGITVGITTGSDAYAGGGGGTGGTQGGAGGTGGLGGGGNGGVGSSGVAGTSGTANTGSGGGSSGDYGPTGAGGDGIIVLRYPSIFTATYALSSTTYNDCTYPVTNTAMYPFDSNANNNSVCATSGSYNGTERGITYTAGKFNNAATYSSSDWNASTGSQIYIDNSVWGGNTSTFSFSTWIKTNGPHVNTTQGYEIPILGNGGTIGSTTGFAIYLQAGKLSGTLCSTALGTGQVFFGNTTAIDDSAWHHVAFTFDDSSGAYILYLDGASYASGTSSTAFRGDPTPTYNTYIGNRWNRNENGVFPGQIDQLRIFANTVLTGAQVTNLYNEVGGVANAEVTDGTDKYIQILGGTGTITFSNSATTTGRPTSPAEGLLRDNTDTGALEFYNGSLWQQIAGTLVPDYTPPTATGNFITTLFTGNSTTVTTGFQADLAWVANRNNANGNFMFDTVRGASNILWPTDTYDEAVRSGVTAFNATDTTIGNYSSITPGGANVQWAWKAGGTAVTNTDGTISSQVSANQTTGFSIVKYTGTASAATVGHGLGAPAELIVTKNLDSAVSWAVYSEPTGVDKYFEFNDFAAAYSLTSYWSSSAPTSTVFGLYNGSSNSNTSGEAIIAYCWTSITGYSKVGSYAGSNANGKVVTTGFEPGWIMIKATDYGGYWIVVDNQRTDGGNGRYPLYIDSHDAEGSALNIDFTSTGFTLQNTDASVNGSYNYIYLAIRS